MLSKKKARRTAEVLLEACHKLKRQDVGSFVETNFESAWNHFDQNNEGWLRYEETFQFVRHLFGKLNKFVGAPGSITDLESGGTVYPLVYPLDSDKTKVGKVSPTLNEKGKKGAKGKKSDKPDKTKKSEKSEKA